MKTPRLDARRDVSGEISRKHGNTRVEKLRQRYGAGFAKGLRGEATLREVLDSISEEDRELLLKGKSFKVGARVRWRGEPVMEAKSLKKANPAPITPKNAEPASETSLLDKITDWTGDGQEAEYWYRKVPIPAFGNKTADQVRAAGMGSELGHFIEGLLSGEFA